MAFDNIARVVAGLSPTANVIIPGLWKPATIAVLISLSVACDGRSGSSGMNEDQAKARVRTLVTQTLQAVVPDIYAEVDQGVADRIGYCPPPATGLVAKSYAAHLPVQSPNRYRAIATATQEYWKRQGFAIVGADSPGGASRVFARTPDRVDLSYRVATDGSSWMTADSPCVTPTSPSP
jgi:hypothetical protein